MVIVFDGNHPVVRVVVVGMLMTYGFIDVLTNGLGVCGLLVTARAH